MIISRTSLLLPTLTALLSLGLVSCSSDDDEEDPVLVKYGELKTSLLDSTDIETVDLTAAACTSSSDTGLFTGVFTGASGAKLDIKIKDFSTTAKTYTCTQAESNREGDLGEKFTGCAVEFSVVNTGSGGGLNTYSTYRNETSTGDFTFAGACTVTTTYTAPKVSLTVACANLIQTKFRSLPTNPINPATVATVDGETKVECSI